jgi:predicted transcriptional regulator
MGYGLFDNVFLEDGMNANENPKLAGLTAEIVTAYVGYNSVPPEELSTIISAVHTALRRAPIANSEPEPPHPFVSIRKSVRPDYIVCLEDGKKFKSLKRHLQVHGMTPTEYREKWGLKSDYPMVAPDYSASRSALAKSRGFGRKAEGEPTPATAKPARSRKKASSPSQ